MPIELNYRLENAKEIERVLLELAKEFGARNALAPMRSSLSE